MAINLILSTDTLETGFRVKANANFNEIIESITALTTSGAYNGKFSFDKNGGGQIVLDLSPYYYTKVQVAQLISAISSSPYSGAWNSTVSYGAQSVVDHNGTFWRSNASGNIGEPGVSGTWDDILAGISPPDPLTIPLLQGSSYPLNITALGAYIGGFKGFSAFQIITSNPTDGYKDRSVNSVVIDKNYTDSTKAALISIDIYGTENPDVPGTTLGNLIVTIF